MTALLANVPFTVGGFVKATFIGAFSAAVTFGIGTGVSEVTQLVPRMTFAALAHGAFNGMMSGVQGGNFWSGFAAGSLSSLAAGLWQGGGMTDGADGAKRAWSGLGGTWGGGDFGTIAFGTVSGGAGAALTGGNFWQGAVTGLMVSGLNDVMHHQVQKQNNTLYNLFDKILDSEIGTTINVDDAIKKYNLDPEIKQAINSVKLVSKGKVYVNWNSEDRINKYSFINVKDGILNIERVNLPKSNNGFYNGFKITGGNLQLDTGGFWGSTKLFKNLFLGREGTLSGIISQTKTQTILTTNSYGL
jgi:hypothetical protein